MDGTQCYEPSSLLVSVHTQLPFLTDVGDSDKTVDLVLNLGENTREFYDYFVRALFWGIFIVVLTLILLGVSCCCYCCSICCFCVKERGEESKSKAAKCTCGVLLLLITGICLSMCVVGLWAEVEMDKRITDHDGKINGFLKVVFHNNSSATQGGDPVINPFITAEEWKHWTMIACFIVLVVLLITVTLAVVCTPLCKTPATMVMVVALLTAATFVTSMVAGGLFSFLIILSDVCHGLYNSGGGDSCKMEVSSFTNSLDAFCNDSFQYGMISFGVTCGIIVGYILIQILGAIYAGLLTGHSRERHQRKESEIELEGKSVWDEYGGHGASMSGLTESGDVLESFESTLQLYPTNGDKSPFHHSSLRSN